MGVIWVGDGIVTTTAPTVLLGEVRRRRLSRIVGPPLRTSPLFVLAIVRLRCRAGVSEPAMTQPAYGSGMPV